MSDRLDCEPIPSSVRSARLFVVDKLQEWRCDELVDQAALLTSELATNAVLHTQQPYSVRVERRPGRVRVEVADATQELPGRPRPLDVDLPDDDDDPWFSGLAIVDATAAAWGTDPKPGNGKVVWFELTEPDERDGERRDRVADLRDLRSPEPTPAVAGAGLLAGESGERAGQHPLDQEASPMAKREYIVDEDDRVVEGRWDEGRRRGGAGRWLLVLLAIAALVVAGFFLLGGSADVDTKGDLEVPEVDVDINNPDVDVTTEEAPPASADAG